MSKDSTKKGPVKASKADFPVKKWQKYRKAPVVIEAAEVMEEVKIPTLEGEMTASPGDYIIQGVKNEFYPCKPDIFEQTYNAVTDDEEPTGSQLAQDYHNLRFTVLPKVTEERDAARREVEELQADLEAHKKKLTETISALKRWSKDLDVFDSKGANQRKAFIVEHLPDDDPASTAAFLSQLKPVADEPEPPKDKPKPSESGAVKAHTLYQRDKPKFPSANVFVKMDGVIYSFNGDALNAATILKMETSGEIAGRLNKVAYIGFVPDGDAWILKMRKAGQALVLTENGKGPVVHVPDEAKADKGDKPSGPETKVDPRGPMFFWQEARRLHIDQDGGNDLIGMWKAQHDLEEMADADYEALAKQLPALVAGALKKAFEAINKADVMWLGKEPYELTDGRHQLVMRIEDSKQVYVVPKGADAPAHHLMALAKNGKLKIGDPLVAANGVVKMYEKPAPKTTSGAQDAGDSTGNRKDSGSKANGASGASKPTGKPAPQVERIDAGKPEGGKA